MRQHQKDNVQLEADGVLKPFDSVLSGFTHRRLLEAALHKVTMSPPVELRLVSPTEPAGSDWLIETAPVISMTQDRRALVLDNAIRLFAPGVRNATYARTVRVVLRPLPAAAESPDDPTGSEVANWLADEGRLLIDSSAALLAESLELALGDSARPPGEDKSPHRTFRYVEGGVERMERAQFVGESCERTVIRTLRGWLMSIPVAAPPGTGTHCPPR